MSRSGGDFKVQTLQIPVLRHCPSTKELCCCLVCTRLYSLCQQNYAKIKCGYLVKFLESVVFRQEIKQAIKCGNVGVIWIRSRGFIVNFVHR